MNGEKPLNILADQEIKPDIEVTTKIPGTGSVPVPPPPQPIQKPQTALQDALGSTIGKMVPPENRGTAQDTSVPTERSKVIEGLKNFLQKPIRTYESDVAEVMSHNQASVSTIAIAQQKKVEKEKKNEIAGIPPPSMMKPSTMKGSVVKEPRKSYAKQSFLLVVSLILIGGGIAAGYYLYGQSALSTPAPVVKKPLVVKSIIPADAQRVVMVDGIAKEQFIPTIVNEFGKNNANKQISELLLGEKSGETALKITGSSFISRAGFTMSDVLKRSLTDTWMIGTYTEESSDKTPFLVFATDFFQNSFAGMLEWEKNGMPDDLSTLLSFASRAREDGTVGTTTISAYFGIRGSFIDKQIRNRDVREFIGRNNNLLFLYSFIDKNTIIFTTTESSLKGLLDRVEKQTYVR